MSQPSEVKEAADGEDTGSPPPLSRPARLVVALAVAACVTTAIVHVCLVFLYVAPSNTVSQRYAQQINAWIYPYFEQNWQLFAPDPQYAQPQISARVATTSPNGARKVGDWVDLTAVDVAEVRDNPFPSHTAQNMLRRAWAAYADAHGTGGSSDSERARMLQAYLLNIATERVADQSNRAFDAVQLRVVVNPIAPEARAAGGAPPVAASNIRYLPWWQVTSLDD
ncbi:hypothetical protein ABIA33_003576 [Streptacidiphilus sp. MAP12-16]|uniref:DUF5819 family protein n=1 Tax=Streptacidiphilus sp. MAP12-16 TaxID=3156300 RepID=UPI0035147F22